MKRLAQIYPSYLEHVKKREKKMLQSIRKKKTYARLKFCIYRPQARGAAAEQTPSGEPPVSENRPHGQAWLRRALSSYYMRVLTLPDLTAASSRLDRETTACPVLLG